MFNRFAAIIAAVLLAGTVASAQQLRQPLPNYGGPRLQSISDSAPSTPATSAYVPSGNLCERMRAWEKKSGFRLDLGAPIEFPEYREMVIAGGGTGWVWVPKGTRYWEHNGTALFFGPLPDNLDLPRNRGTGCCNPVGRGVPKPPPPPAPPIVAEQPKPAPAPPPAVPRIVIRDSFKTNTTINQKIVVQPPPPPPKKGWCGGKCKGFIIGGAIVGGVIGGKIALASEQKGSSGYRSPGCTPDPVRGGCVNTGR